MTAIPFPCLLNHLDEHFSGLSRIPYFSQEGHMGSERYRSVYHSRSSSGSIYPRLNGAAFADGRCPRPCAGAESSSCLETLFQACIRREFPRSRKRGLSGDREGRIHVAAIPLA